MRNLRFQTKLYTVQKGIACFTVNWSPYILMDRYLIHGIVPSEGGIFQIYRKQDNQLNLIMVDRAFYGGLRNRLRELIDPLYMGYNPYREILENEECYARYSLVSLQDDMDDLMYFFTGKDATGRFEDVFVEEKDTLEIRKNP